MNTSLVNQSFNLKEKKKKQETKTILVKEMKVYRRQEGKKKRKIIMSEHVVLGVKIFFGFLEVDRMLFFWVEFCFLAMMLFFQSRSIFLWDEAMNVSFAFHIISCLSRSVALLFWDMSFGACNGNGEGRALVRMEEEER